LKRFWRITVISELWQISPFQTGPAKMQAEDGLSSACNAIDKLLSR